VIAATPSKTGCRDHSLVTHWEGKPTVPTLKLRQDTVRTLPYQGVGQQ